MGNSSKKLEEIEVVAELVTPKIDLQKQIVSRLELLDIALKSKVGYSHIERNNMQIDRISLIQIKGIIEFMPNTEIVKDLKLKV